ncbi:Apple-like protein [Artemisia annua]|uniref:Apple-like protein n=1 Tax=Artemisia annua TaxID=35608 RepID=A0A2U1LZ92_ARTAN|nr:Apple-like protein [Artemisia annua]
MDPNGFPQFFLRKNVTERYRSGPWNGRRFSGVPEMKSAINLIEFEFVNDADEISYSFDMLNDSVYSRLIMSTSGELSRFMWVETSQMWSKYWRSELDCESDGFLPLKNMKLPESSKVFVDKTMNLSTCATICKRNCSCAAYANMNITQGGSGCVIWEVDLFDMRQYADSEGGGQDLYVRVAASDLGKTWSLVRRGPNDTLHFELFDQQE